MAEWTARPRENVAFRAAARLVRSLHWEVNRRSDSTLRRRDAPTTMAEIDPRVLPAAVPHGVGIYDRPPPRRSGLMLALLGLAAVVALSATLYLFLRHT